jgi:hypothetical protein
MSEAQTEAVATSVLDRLKPVCSADKDRARIATPFAMTYEGRKWACATDGHVLAALPFDGDLRGDGPDAVKVIPAAPPTHKTTIAALRHLAGKIAFETCDKCDGSGEVAHDCDCSLCTYSGSEPCGRCDGEGKWRKQRPAQIGPVVFDRNLLALVLGSGPEAGEVRVGPLVALEPIRFRTADWLALVMPIHATDEQTNEAKRHVLVADPLEAP